MSITSELERFVKTDAFKKKVAEAKKRTVLSGGTFGGGGKPGEGISLKQMREQGQKMKEILYRHVHEVIASVEYEDICVGEPELQEDGTFVVNVYFEPAAMERWSLDPYRYGKVDNIAVLLTHGWDKTSGQVVGVWHGEVTRSLMERDGNPFMQVAVEEFMAETGVKAILDEKYL